MSSTTEEGDRGPWQYAPGTVVVDVLVDCEVELVLVEFDVELLVELVELEVDDEVEDVEVVNSSLGLSPHMLPPAGVKPHLEKL